MNVGHVDVVRRFLARIVEYEKKRTKWIDKSDLIAEAYNSLTHLDAIIRNNEASDGKNNDDLIEDAAYDLQREIIGAYDEDRICNFENIVGSIMTRAIKRFQVNNLDRLDSACWVCLYNVDGKTFTRMETWKTKEQAEFECSKVIGFIGVYPVVPLVSTDKKE